MNKRIASLGLMAMALASGSFNALAQDDASLRRGQAIFSNNCMGCHAATPGNIGTMVLSKRLPREKAVLAQRDDLAPAFTSAIVRHGIGIMPGFRPTEISDAELVDLAAYLGRKH